MGKEWGVLVKKGRNEMRWEEQVRQEGMEEGWKGEGKREVEVRKRERRVGRSQIFQGNVQ